VTGQSILATSATHRGRCAAGWLAVRLAALDVAEWLIKFERPGPTRAIAELSPNGLVPLLEHKGALVWESLSICDYCAEIEPSL
jgi:glutathione S-transferase